MECYNIIDDFEIMECVKDAVHAFEYESLVEIENLDILTDIKAFKKSHTKSVFKTKKSMKMMQKKIEKIKICRLLMKDDIKRMMKKYT